MREVSILVTHYDEQSGTIIVAKEIVQDDNSIEINGQSVSVDTLEWWAALYDSNDFDELIEFIIFEPFIENFNPLDMPPEEAKSRMRASLSDFKSRVTTNGMDQTQRVAKLQRAGMEQRFIDAAANDPRQEFRRLSLNDPAEIGVKSSILNQQRAEISQEKVLTGTRERIIAKNLDRSIDRKVEHHEEIIHENVIKRNSNNVRRSQ